MHSSIGDYLSSLGSVGRSPLTVKAARSDLTGIVAWWETRRQRPLSLRSYSIAIYVSGVLATSEMMPLRLRLLIGRSRPFAHIATGPGKLD
jgi:hypothetical protein